MMRAAGVGILRRLAFAGVLLAAFARPARAQATFDVYEYLFDPLASLGMPYKSLGAWLCPPLPRIGACSPTASPETPACVPCATDADCGGGTCGVLFAPTKTQCWVGDYVGGRIPGEGPWTVGLCSYGIWTDVIIENSDPLGRYLHGGGIICPPDQGAFCESIGTAHTQWYGGGGTDWGSRCIPWPPQD